ncbi:MAG: hypothetical protein M5U23_06470 [Acidimicrobiia bacterium]|nr:hypothetical protein [Acidimicrobiia bacterium]
MNLRVLLVAEALAVDIDSALLAKTMPATVHSQLSARWAAS